MHDEETPTASVAREAVGPQMPRADERPVSLVRDAWPYVGDVPLANGYADLLNARSAADADQYGQYIKAMSDIDCAYQCGMLDEALDRCNALLEASDTFTVRLFALTKRLYVHVAQGNGDAAHADLCRVRPMCEEGMRRQADAVVCDASCLCALSMETMLASAVFSSPRVVTFWPR